MLDASTVAEVLLAQIATFLNSFEIVLVVEFFGIGAALLPMSSIYHQFVLLGLPWI